MRALVFRGPWDMAVEDRPEPTPGPTDTLLEILATGICGSDLHGYTGDTGRRHPGQVMGHETVARVVVDRTGTHAPGRVVTVNPVLGCGHCAACAAGQAQRCLQRRVIGVQPELSAGVRRADGRAHAQRRPAARGHPARPRRARGAARRRFPRGPAWRPRGGRRAPGDRRRADRPGRRARGPSARRRGRGRGGARRAPAGPARAPRLRRGAPGRPRLAAPDARRGRRRVQPHAGHGARGVGTGRAHRPGGHGGADRGPRRVRRQHR